MASIFSFLQGGVSPFRTLLNTVRPLPVPPIKLGEITVADAVTPDPLRLFDATSNIFPTAFADVRASNATAFGSSSFLRTYSSNVARIETDPKTTSILGLLVEPSDTNLILQSGALTNAAWSALNSAISAGTAIAPDGSTFFTITANSGATLPANFGCRPTTALTLTSGALYTLFAYVQLGTANQQVYLQAGDSSNTAGKYATAIFNLYTNPTSDTTAVTTGVGANGGSVASTSAEYIGGGTFRISMTFSLNTTSVFPKLGFADPANSAIDTASGNVTCNYAGGQTVRYSLVQLEADSVLSSYIQTTTAAATRAADSISFTLGASTTDLQFTFDDGSTQTVSGLTPSSTYTIPTNLNRAWILYIDDVTSGGGTTVSGDGASSGTATVTAVGAETAAAAGASTGSASVSATGAETAAAAGSSTGSATVTAVGRSTSAASGASSGAAAVTAVGASTEAGAGAATGSASVTATGAATKAAAGSATGSGSATGVGTETAAAVGSAAGSGTATAGGAETFAAVGSSAGSGSASAVGAAKEAAAGSSTGSATVTGAGNTLASGSGTGAATGVATVTGVGAKIAAATGTAIGSATATAAAGEILAATGSSVGAGSAGAVGASIRAATGAAAGSSTAAGTGATGGGLVVVSASGLAVGSSTATAVGAAVGVHVGKWHVVDPALAVVPQGGFSDGFSDGFEIDAISKPWQVATAKPKITTPWHVVNETRAATSLSGAYSDGFSDGFDTGGSDKVWKVVNAKPQFATQGSFSKDFSADFEVSIGTQQKWRIVASSKPSGSLGAFDDGFSDGFEIDSVADKIWKKVA